MAGSLPQTIGFYSYLFTSPLGFIGHICSLITFSSKLLRLSSTGLLFIFLTLSDILYLLMSIYDFIAFTLQLPILLNDHLCRFLAFMINFTTVTSAWLLVLIALDRLIRTRFPYRQAQICTQKVAAYSVAIVCVCSTLFTSHVLQPEFTSNNVKGICGPSRSPPTSYSLFYFNAWPTLQLIIAYLIPSFVMIVSVIGVQSKLRVQQTLFGGSMRRERVQRHILILMVSSAVCFIFCTVPYSICRIIFQRTGTMSANMVLISVLLGFLNMNYCYNFYIYCLTSHLFRRKFIARLERLFTYCKKERRQSWNIPILLRQHSDHPHQT